MKMNKKLLLASTVALSALPLFTTKAEEQPQNWTAEQLSKLKRILRAMKTNKRTLFNMVTLWEISLKR